MTNQQHSITPPPELVQQWIDANRTWLRGIALEAAQWGADQELEACCEWLEEVHCEDPQDTPYELRAARRPKPLSLKKVALLQLDVLNADLFERGLGRDLSQIRRALEQLDD